MLTVLFSPEPSSLSALHALRVWGQDVIPSLFPYMVLCQSLSTQLVRHPRVLAFAAPIMGIFGGSPSGSALLYEVFKDKAISSKKLLCLCALTGTISPMFFLGPVSVWFGSHTIGKQLLISHFSGAAASCLAIFLLPVRSDSLMRTESFSINHCRSPIQRSIDSALNVGGCIVFFSVAASALKTALPWLNASLGTIVHSILEVSGGIRALSQCTLHQYTQTLIAAAATGFSGFSILTQNHTYLKPLGIKMYQLILLGFLRAVFCMLFMIIILLVDS